MLNLNNIMDNILQMITDIAKDHKTMIIETVEGPYCLNLEDIQNVEMALRIHGKNNLISLFTLEKVLSEKIWISKNKVMLVSNIRELKEENFVLRCANGYYTPGMYQGIMPYQEAYELFDVTGYMICDVFVTSEMEFNSVVNKLVQLDGDVVKRITGNRCSRIASCLPGVKRHSTDKNDNDYLRQYIDCVRKSGGNDE